MSERNGVDVNRLVLGMHTRDFQFAHVIEEPSGRRFRWSDTGYVAQVVGGSDRSDSYWRKAGKRDAERVRTFISENVELYHGVKAEP